MNNYIIYHYSRQVTQSFLDIVGNFKERWSCGKDLIIIRSEKSADVIFQELSQCLFEGDELIVTRIDKKFLHSGFSGDCAGWLDSKL